MARVIAITNQKGGVGKTTTTVNLASQLAGSGKQVLVIDMDPQGNTSSGLGLDQDDTEESVYELLLGDCELRDCILQFDYKQAWNKKAISLIPAKIDLAGAETELFTSGAEDKEYLLRNKIQGIRDRYDYILIDCPPSLGLLTINALTTADTVLIPVQCEYYALEGLAQLLQTIELVQERLNEELSIEGLVFTMYDSHTKLSRQVIDDVRENLEAYLFETVIPRNVRLAEAPSYGCPVDIYDRRSVGARRYKKLARELIRKNQAEAQNESGQKSTEQKQENEEAKPQDSQNVGHEEVKPQDGQSVDNGEAKPQDSHRNDDAENVTESADADNK